ncbi:NAD-dependent succinate-semialdehyde dehydrogenase [Ostreibacterium oceani]
MMMTATKHTRDNHLSQLNDPTLFKEFSFIDGKWVNATDHQTMDVYNPANQNWLGNIPMLSAEQSQTAINAAQSAFAQWAGLLPHERSQYLRRWFELIIANRDDLALIMTLEQGKGIDDARGEIDYAAAFIEFYAEEAKRPNIEGVTSHLQHAEMELWREPIGIVGLITPWNFPCAMITRKAAAALAAGCPVVIHPSYETPYSALALAELATRAGIPAGIFNVLTGDAATIVAPWMHDVRVRAISFTGSTEVGKLLYRQSAETVKKLVLELGGHAPFIAFEDAAVDAVVAHAIAAKFATSGQDCLAANRLFIHRHIYTEFCEKFAAATEKLSVGEGINNADINPLINEKAVQKQCAQVQDAITKGAQLLTGGQPHPAGINYMTPTVLADVPDNADIMHEETFGPVAAIIPFDDEDAVIQRANDSEYGLVAYVHTQNAHRIYRVTRALNYGMVAVNRTKITGAPIPFGGTKQSGLGREGARLGMEEFTEIKYVCRYYA